MVGKAVYAMLVDSLPVTEMVGSGDNARIFPVAIHQGEPKPAITYRISNSLPHDTKSGVSDTDRDEVEIIPYSDKYHEVDELAEKIRQAVDGMRGEFGGVSVNESYYIDQEDDYEPNARIFFRIMTFQIWINR